MNRWEPPDPKRFPKQKLYTERQERKNQKKTKKKNKKKKIRNQIQRQSEVEDRTHILFEKVDVRSCDPSRKGGDAPTKSDCKALVNVVVPNLIKTIKRINKDNITLKVENKNR